MDKIDLVPLWADWRDRARTVLKRKYYASGADVTSSDPDAKSGIIHDRDCGPVKYWFCAEECFALWGNRVFFCACGRKQEC